MYQSAAALRNASQKRSGYANALLSKAERVFLSQAIATILLKICRHID
jgi:hypothetical protein